MKKVILASLAICFVSMPAYAQESRDLGGFKVGVVAGYDSTRLSLDGESGSKDGLLYGLSAGYDFDLGSAVVGVETEYSDSTVKETVSDVLSAGDEASIAASRDLYVGARLGFAVSPTVLLFAKAGYTNARVTARYSDGSDSFKDSDTLDGYRLGAGAELVKGPTFARLEYRYSDYGDYKYDGVNTGISVARHQVALTGGYRF